MEKVNNRRMSSKAINIFLLGCLSMFFAEVYSGSSPLWFLEAWGWLITFPLYLSHILFFLNIAIKTKRTTIGHLYLFGALFGLYEGLITRVLWFGYPNSEGPIFGTIGGTGGIAILEYLTLVFFWHPIFAFIIPILVYEVFIVKGGENTTGIFPSHTPWLRKTRKNKIIFTLLTLMGSLFLALSLNYDPIRVAIAVIGSSIIVMAAYLISQKYSCTIDIRGFELGKKGFGVLLIYMILGLYIPMWFIMDTILPYPNIWGILLYVLSYVALISLLWCYPRIKDDRMTSPGQIYGKRTENIFTKRDIMLSWFLIVVLSIPYSFIHPWVTFLATIGFISMPIVGTVLFTKVIYYIAKTRTSRRDIRR